MSEELRDRARGLLLGMALGDALGRPVDRLSWSEIRAVHGPHGRTEPDEGAVPGEDAAMAAAMARAMAATIEQGPDAMLDAIVSGLTGWRRRGEPVPEIDATLAEATDRLALGVRGSEAAVAWSKDSAGAVRSAPLGLLLDRFPGPMREASIAVAALTHGHPTAHASAVALSTWIREALRGVSPAWWIDSAQRAVSGLACGELLDALSRIPLAGADVPGSIEDIGQGWVVEEALAMALLALLRSPDEFPAAVCRSVNHGGKSATVGAIAGALAGARLGASRIPRRWRERLVGAGSLEALADDLLAARERVR